MKKVLMPHEIEIRDEILGWIACGESFGRKEKCGQGKSHCPRCKRIADEALPILGEIRMTYHVLDMIRRVGRSRDKGSLDAAGRIFGFAKDGDQVRMFIEDDERYYEKLSFHGHWMDDLVETAEKMRKKV